ncbi:hypothetical protein RDABS01_003060 [Bienertia sinuspersici]
MRNFNFWVCFSFCFSALSVGTIPITEAQVSSTEARILLQLEKYLEHPDALESWKQWTDFCFLPSINCHWEQNVSFQTSNPLTAGKFSVSQQTLSEKFSLDSLFTVLTKLSNLKKLSLWKCSRFKYLKRSSRSNLSNNQIGPNFPSLGSNIVSIIMRNNTLRSEIPSQKKPLINFKKLDASSNNLVGPLPPSIFSLPALWYLNLAENQLTGELPNTTNCGKRLWFVDISRNFSWTTSKLHWFRVANIEGIECVELSFRIKVQHPASFCQRQVLLIGPKSMRMPFYGLPSYQSFTLQELEDATNNFDQLNLVEEGSQGQLYKGYFKVAQQSWLDV